MTGSGKVVAFDVATIVNAIAMSKGVAIGKKLDDKSVLNLSIEFAFKAKTALSGAFDDVYAPFYGKMAVTDNLDY